MDFIKRLESIQLDLKREKMDGWLIYDYRNCNALIYPFLGISTDKMISRRFFYWIPQKGTPLKIVPLIEPYTLDHLPGLKWDYRGWQDLERHLLVILSKEKKIAMEYSPNNALPNISKVDAGTIEQIRKMGVEVVSSANLLQKYTSVWTQDQFQSHLAAAEVLEKVVDNTWVYIEQSLRSGQLLTEYTVQQYMLQEMDENQCETAVAPTCAVNAHSADPHYHPTVHQAFPIRFGDFILLDLWCKKKIPHAVYADITRVGVAASTPTQRQQEIFSLVKNARDRGTDMVKKHYENGLSLQGWQVDQVCRDVIEKEGFGDFFIHRTGHNIGEEVHGAGANLDNLETHDDRELLGGTCFSVEPGVYLPGEFGVRLEYDVYLDPGGKVVITGGIQEKLMCMRSD